MVVKKTYSRIYSKGYTAGKLAAMKGMKKKPEPVKVYKPDAMTGPEVQRILNRSLGTFAPDCEPVSGHCDYMETAAAIKKFLWSFCGSGAALEIRRWYKDEDGRL